MKAMRIAVVLSMFAASSALGAMSIDITPAAAIPDAGGNLVLTFSLNHGGDATPIGGFSIFPSSDKPGKVVISPWAAPDPASRVRQASWLVDGDFTVGNLPALLSNKPIEAITDLGAATADVTVLNDGGVSGPLFSLALRVTDMTALPIKLTFKGGLTTNEYADVAIADSSVTILPEPASMILLAVGGAFFARRRKVA